MIRKTLAVGIIFLFIASTVTPAVISIDEPEEDDFFENIAYVTDDENTINGQQIVTKEIASFTNGDDVDWWPQYHHDLQLTGYTTSTAPNTNKVLWNAGSFGMDWYSPTRMSLVPARHVISPSKQLSGHFKQSSQSCSPSDMNI